MPGVYWLTILPDTKKLKPAIDAAMRGVKIKADFGVDEAKARKAGKDAAQIAESEASKSKPRIKPEADKGASDKAGRDAANSVSGAFRSAANGEKLGQEVGGKVASGLKSSLALIGPMLAGASLFSGLKAAISEGMDFTTSMNTMAGVTRATGEQLQQVSAIARQLGTDVSLPGVSATTAAQAMTELAKGGFSVQEAMDAARGTLQLAGAAGIDAASAATIQADALHTFGLSAKDAGYAADVLANVANASTGEITDFAAGLQQSGAVAKQFGMSIDDTAAALGTLANKGIKGSDAGTLIKSALLAITDQGKPAQGAIEKLGLTLYDAQGKFVGMGSMMDQLSQAAKRMSPEMYQAATNTLFGSDAARLAGVAATEGATGFNALKEAVNKQGGAADMAAAKTQGLPGAWANFQNTVDNVKLSIFDMVQGPLTSLLNQLSGLPDFISRNSDAFKIAAGVITTLLLPAMTAWTIAQAKSVAMSIASAIGTLIGSWASMGSAILNAAAAAGTYVIAIGRVIATSVISGFTAMVGAIRNLSIGTRIAAAAQWLFNAALTANPIGLIVAGIAALVAGLVYFFTRTELGRKIWAGFTEYLKVAWEAIKIAFSAAWNFISGIWQKMVEGASTVWNGIKEKFTAVVDFVKELPGKITNAAKGLWDGLKHGLVDVLNWIGDKWNAFANGMSFNIGDKHIGLPTLPRFSYSSGGYTGSGAIDRIAGVVHGGEHVIKASSRESLERDFPGLLDYLNRTGRLPGYGGGGTVALGNISGPGITTDEQRSMWDAIRTKFPNAVLSSATREVMTEGHPDYHNAGRAIDISGPGMAQIAAWIAQTYPDSLELIHAPFGHNIKNGKDVGDGVGFYGAGTMAGHQDHVHWALGKTANTSAGASTSAGSSSASGTYRAATDSELSASSNRVSAAQNSVTQAKQSVDDNTYRRDRAQQRLDAARAGGKDTTDAQHSLDVANRELADANDRLAKANDRLTKATDDDTELRTKGKLVKEQAIKSASSSSGGDSSGSDFGKMLMSGLLESIGLDGSLFSNPLEWPTVKSAMAGVNYFGGLLSGGGGTSDTADATGVGNMLSAIPDAINGSPALAPGDINPMVPGDTLPATPASVAPAGPAGGGGPVIDNSVNVTATGMSPDQVATKVKADFNHRTRTTKVN